MDKDTRVVAVRDIGGWLRDRVPRGSRGKVVYDGGRGQDEVAFKVKRGDQEEIVTISVADHEVTEDDF